MPCVVFSQKSQLKQGDIYFEARKYAEAIQSYNNYKKINKKPDALIKRGFAYLKTNNPDAIEDLIVLLMVTLACVTR